jgi:hypothetical protein
MTNQRSLDERGVMHAIALMGFITALVMVDEVGIDPAALTTIPKATRESLTRWMRTDDPSEEDSKAVVAFVESQVDDDLRPIAQFCMEHWGKKGAMEEMFEFIAQQGGSNEDTGTN